MKKIIFIFLISGLTFSCSSTKKTAKAVPIVNAKPIGLEQFLTLKNSYVKIPITKMASGHLHLNASILN